MNSWLIKQSWDIRGLFGCSRSKCRVMDQKRKLMTGHSSFSQMLHDDVRWCNPIWGRSRCSMQGWCVSPAQSTCSQLPSLCACAGSPVLQHDFSYFVASSLVCRLFYPHILATRLLVFRLAVSPGLFGHWVLVLLLAPDFVWLCLDWWCWPLPAFVFLLFHVAGLDQSSACSVCAWDQNALLLVFLAKTVTNTLHGNSQFWASSLFSLCSHALHPTGYERLSHSFIHGTYPEGLRWNGRIQWYSADLGTKVEDKSGKKKTKYSKMLKK